MSTIINPDNYSKNYINYLNTCFPNWGNEETYNWVFNRKIGKHQADIMLITDENNEVIAGSGVTYRTLKIDNTTINVGIMTGSWTLPQARGKGCFTQIIKESVTLCAQKKVPFLTAFVTETNASYRRLKEAGCYELEANNYFSNESLFDVDESIYSIHIIKPNLDEFYKLYLEFGKENDIFEYSKEEFNNQYINKLILTHCAIINNNYFLFEENETTVRLTFISQSDIKTIQYFCNYIRKNKNKKVMFFSTNKQNNKALEQHNFASAKAFLMIKEAKNQQENRNQIFEKLQINLADKM